MEIYVTSNGRIVIPAELRRKYGIEQGTRVVVVDHGDSIALKPITGQYLKRLQGSLKDTDALEVLMGERNRDKK